MFGKSTASACQSGFKETDSQEDLLFRGQSVRSYRSYHLAGLPGDDGLSEASKSSLTRLQALVERADFLAAEDPASADERAIISASQGMVFPLQLAHVFSVAFEEELSTEWNSARSCKGWQDLWESQQLWLMKAKPQADRGSQ
ncbi:unnamed protein product [Durusdinium trenchii]|uniref:Uncharacterized protein n=1 Tax=Durusdinium trenchii TaxID=1381693 RepID=A0ABP0KWT1_9DINO